MLPWLDVGVWVVALGIIGTAAEVETAEEVRTAGEFVTAEVGTAKVATKLLLTAGITMVAVGVTGRVNKYI